MSYDAWFDGCFDLGPDKEKWPEIFQLFWSDLERSCTSLRRDILRWLSKRECRQEKNVQTELNNLLPKIKQMLNRFAAGEYGKPDKHLFMLASEEFGDMHELFEIATYDVDWFDLGSDDEKRQEKLNFYWSKLKRDCLLLRKDIRRWLSKKVCKEDKSMQKELINLLQQVKLMLKKFHTEEFGKRDEESFLSAWDDYQDIVCSFENATSDE